MRYLLASIMLTVLLAPALAETRTLAVIVNPDSEVDSLSRSDAVNIFMGRYGRLPSGVVALPLDLSIERESFYLRLLDRTPAEINSYWARLVFSGRGSPPRRVNSSDELLDIVAQNRGAISYLPAHLADDRVRVVLLLD